MPEHYKAAGFDQSTWSQTHLVRLMFCCILKLPEVLQLSQADQFPMSEVYSGREKY